MSSFILLLLILRLWRWHLDKYPPPSPQSHYLRITVIYFHLALYAILSTYYVVRISFSTKFSPLPSQPIQYNIINYDCNYDEGISDFPRFVLDQSCISSPHQAQVFIQSYGTVDREGSHHYLHHPLSIKEGWL